MSKVHCLLVLTALLALAAQPRLAIANDSVMNHGADGIQPLDARLGLESPLRLVEEELTFRFGRWRTSVVARFVFENTRADSTVRELSGFPDVHGSVEDTWSGPVYKPGEAAVFDRENRRNPLRDMVTRIDGRRVKSDVRFGFVAVVPESGGAYTGIWVPVDSISGDRVRWYVVELVVPPRGRVTLERRYNVRNGTQMPDGAHFSYYTVTGGGWQGTIGRLRATLLLVDDLTPEHVWRPFLDLPDSLLGDQASDKDWRIVAPGRMELEWTDFDPWRDESKRLLEFAWEPLPGEPWEAYEVLYKKEPGSRWWPWNWFR